DTDIKCVCTAIERLEGGYDVFASLDFCCNDLEAERAGRCLDLAHIQHNGGTTDIGQDRQPAETGDNLAQKFESFGRKNLAAFRRWGSFEHEHTAAPQGDEARAAPRRCGTRCVR